MNTNEMRELDAWIAENVMGLIWDNLYAKWYDKTTQIKLPHYTTDPAAAMVVLEKCAENGTDITVFKSRMTNKWVAEWGSGKKAYLGITETADTLPLAICLFAKKLFTK